MPQSPLKNIIQQFALASLSRAKLLKVAKFSTKAINGFVSFLSSLATVGAFAFAIWAYHYSSIPEKLVEKFNSEIAALNEETTDIRRQKRLLEDQLLQDSKTYKMTVEEREQSIELLTLEKVELEKEITSYKEEKEKLQDDLKSVKVENIQNQKYRKAYLADSVASIFGVTFTDPLKKELKILREQAEQAKDFPVWLEIVAEQERFETQKREYGILERTLSPTDIKLKEIKIQSEFNEYLIEKIPDTWLDSILYGMGIFREERDSESSENLSSDDQPAPPRIALAIKLIGDKTEWRHLPYKDLALAFRKTLAIKTDIPKARKIIEFHIDAKKALINEMPENDRIRVNKAIQVFLDKNAGALNKDVSIYVPANASNEDVAEVGKEMLDNINTFEAVIMSMSKELSQQLQ